MRLPAASRLDELDRRISRRWNAELLAELTGRAPQRGPRRSALFVLGAISGLVLIVEALALFVGLYLLWQWPNPLAMLAGLILIAVAVAMRPRVPRLDRGLDSLPADQAPALHKLIKQVADALGSPVPDIVGTDDELNAWCGRSGIRQRSVLVIGLPLWASLDPQARVAVLAHELGHLINKDPTRLLASQPAQTAFGMFAEVTDPFLLQSDRGDSYSDLTNLGVIVFSPILWPISRLFALMHLGVHVLGARNSVRAEIYADSMATRVSGNEAMVRGLHPDLIPAISIAVQRAMARSDDPSVWRAAAAACPVDRLASRQEASMDEQASLFASHPPTGLRMGLIESWPPSVPSVELSAHDAELIDAELARRYLRLHNNVRLS